MEWVMVAVVAILVWGGVKAIQAKHGIISDEDGNEKRVAPAETSADPATKQEIRQLKERVQVLERLVTDRSHLLADEIEALRKPTQQSGVPLNVSTQEKAS